MCHLKPILVRQKWMVVTTSLVGVSCLFLQTTREGLAKEQAVQEENEIKTSISVVLATSGPQLAFTISNNSKVAIKVDPASEVSSPIIFVKPNGNESRLSIPVSRPQPLPAIQPGESKTWKRDATDLFSLQRLYDDGVYRVTWIAKPLGTKLEVRSNEITILQEPTTPDIDPGREVTKR